jgi:hypothetical protein
MGYRKGTGAAGGCSRRCAGRRGVAEGLAGVAESGGLKPALRVWRVTRNATGAALV